MFGHVDFDFFDWRAHLSFVGNSRHICAFLFVLRLLLHISWLLLRRRLLVKSFNGGNSRKVAFTFHVYVHVVLIVELLFTVIALQLNFENILILLFIWLADTGRFLWLLDGLLDLLLFFLVDWTEPFN